MILFYCSSFLLVDLNMTAKRVKRSFLVLLAFSMGAVGSLAVPNENAKEQARSLLTKAAEVTDLEAPGNSPFRLAARVRVSIRGALDAEGTYALDWASPERFHEVITFPGFKDTKVASDGKLWHQRNLAYLPLRVWQFQELMDLRKRIHADLQRKEVKKVRTSDHNGTRSQCIEFPGDPDSYKTCVDATTEVPLSVEEVTPVVTTRWEYSNYAVVGTKTFPRDMRLFEGSKVKVELHIEDLTQVSAPDPTLFSPLQGANVQAWCSDAPPPRILQPMAVHPNSKSHPDYDPGVTRGRVSIYAAIGTDGRLKDMRIVEPLSPKLDAAVLKGAEGVRYQPSICNGVPIEQETVLSVEYFTEQ